MKDEIRVTVIATGFGAARRRRSTRERAFEPRERELEAPVPAAPAREDFQVRDDVLDVPSFLRDE